MNPPKVRIAIRIPIKTICEPVPPPCVTRVSIGHNPRVWDWSRWGEGVLIPHARLDEVSGVQGVFARLASPIDADALDDKRADLVVMLVAPRNDQSDHMKVLSRVTRVLRDDHNRETLRRSLSRDEIYDILTSCD